MTADGDSGDHPLQRIGHYRVDRVLGSGAMGVVYLAHDEAIDRQVAIKTIHPYLLHGEYGTEWLARFRQEVRAAGRCLHPNIVTIFEYGEQDDAPYIVMEYVQGRELSGYLKEHRRLSLVNGLDIIVQVLQALAHAHASGVVHRDIKSGNILLLADGQAKVSDFGIARLDTAIGMTQSGVALGTPSYMSPEQIQGYEVDRRTDLFAVGVVFYELLTGVRPFMGRGTTELMYKVMNDSPRPVTQVNPSLPIELDALFDKALAKLPEQRFQDADEFIAALKVLRQEAIKAVDDGLTATQATPTNLPEASSGAAPPEWEPVFLEHATKLLTVHLGPVAKVLVTKAAQKASHPSELVQHLKETIPNESDRLRFERNMQSSLTGFTTGMMASSAGSASINGSQLGGSLGSFDQAVLETVREELTVHLGPIAKVLVKQAAANARTVQELYAQLADHIPVAATRAAFLKRGEKR